MIATNLILATACLLQGTTARTVNVERQTSNGVIFPKTRLDFAKGNVAAKWAPGYPKEWGTENFRYQFSAPDPEDNFNGAVTSDEKYLIIFNGTHVQVTDLDKNATASTFAFKLPGSNFGAPLHIRDRAQGGYDLLLSESNYYGTPKATVRHRLSADGQPVGDVDAFEGGQPSISPQGKMATTYGKVYDLESSSTTALASLEGEPHITDISISISSDGQYVATVSWTEKTAELWNATSGQKIMDFPPTDAQNWLIRFSPDGAYVAICLGSAKKSVQIYALADLKAAPVEITGFNDWPREMAWSPNNKQLAIGDSGALNVYEVPSKTLLNKWQVDAKENVYLPSGSQFLDGGSKITWAWRDGRYLYDFEANTEWLWTVSMTDHSWGPQGFYYLKKRGYAVTVDGDSTVRFWKL